jgi:hypothetical protein
MPTVTVCTFNAQNLFARYKSDHCPVFFKIQV